ncbi:uncharacterized protein LY89DRAFT_725656 [Mollisia scopiformis]|uniref:Uncharacterized protein n=1 Tax=Mollisia scopiformis TaxID=149040 RepID=A0A132B509_MOLSC|nr:uncharacterized protein LY89DRAFT_725656 [Mollisia scopiformis]KUJ07496.1 hypothetical protein LY89DRAFT_725656 [Mollisia scopiformis]
MDQNAPDPSADLLASQKSQPHTNLSPITPAPDKASQSKAAPVQTPVALEKAALITSQTPADDLKIAASPKPSSNRIEKLVSPTKSTPVSTQPSIAPELAPDASQRKVEPIQTPVSPGTSTSTTSQNRPLNDSAQDVGTPAQPPIIPGPALSTTSKNSNSKSTPTIPATPPARTVKTMTAIAQFQAGLTTSSSRHSPVTASTNPVSPVANPATHANNSFAPIRQSRAHSSPNLARASNRRSTSLPARLRFDDILGMRINANIEELMVREAEKSARNSFHLFTTWLEAEKAKEKKKDEEENGTIWHDLCWISTTLSGTFASGLVGWLYATSNSMFIRLLPNVKQCRTDDFNCNPMRSMVMWSFIYGICLLLIVWVLYFATSGK